MSLPLEPPANPRDDINRIIIGLGGQGSRVVNEVRKAILEQGAIPPGLEFIAIDSDRVALSNLDSVPEDHRVHLAAPDDNITETVVPWLPHEFRPKAGGGCGMQRLTGKAMYLVHRPRILEAVRDVARKLRQRTQVSDFMVVIVNAFGGGTGSGMAIDFSLDVRGDIKELTGQEPMMFGIGILPSRIETIQRANGVAMLKELHFLLSNKEPIVVGGRDHSSPFELYFLVGREVMGIERDEELLQSIMRFTLDLGLIPSASRDHATANKGAGWVDLQDIRTLVKGAGHMFSTFGHYRALFPAETLKQWFAALDEVQALRKELPFLLTSLESMRQAQEDKRIVLAHDQEVLVLARARAAKLRLTGVLGANRPELSRFLSDIARADEDIRKRASEALSSELELEAHMKKRATIDSRLRAAELRAEELKAKLLSPAQSRTTYTMPLSHTECEHLNANRHLVLDGHFASVMKALGRTQDYLDKSMEVVGKNKILYLPLLNYRMAFHTAAAFPPAVLAALRRHGFVRFDAGGNPIVNEEQLWMVMAMLSSNAQNIDATKVSARAFKEVVEGHVARRAEVKLVPALGKPFEVVIHSWMVGVQVAPLAPGYPPRLKELEWLMPEYDQVTREGGLIQHHAFLFGDPLAFARLARAHVDRLDTPGTNERVTAFWAGYSPTDAPARWLQLPPLVAEALACSQTLENSTTLLSNAMDEFRTGSPTAATIERLTAALAQGREAIGSFGAAFVEDPHPLRDRLAALSAQLESTSQPPKDTGRLVAMEELVAEAADAAAAASSSLTQLRSDLPEAIQLTLASARAAPTDAPTDRPRASNVVRWTHLVAQAEGNAARLYEETAQTLRHLQDLTGWLDRLQAIIGKHALAPFAVSSLGAPRPLDTVAAHSPSQNGSGLNNPPLTDDSTHAPTEEVS